MSDSYHNYQRPVKSGNDEEEDPLEVMLDKNRLQNKCIIRFR